MKDRNEKDYEDCAGCVDRHSEGTHAMHTKQHPCPDGGDPACGECFPMNPEDEIVAALREIIMPMRMLAPKSADALEEWLRTTLTSYRQRIEKEMIEDLSEKVSAMKWDEDSIEMGSEFATPRDYRKLGRNNGMSEVVKMLQAHLKSTK